MRGLSKNQLLLFTAASFAFVVSTVAVAAPHERSRHGKKILEQQSPKVALGRAAIEGTSADNFADRRVDEVMLQFNSRPLLGAINKTVTPAIRGDRSSFLSAVYESGIVAAPAANALLLDKLIFYKVVQRELKEDTANWLVRSIGLKEFLISHHFVDERGRLNAEGDAIESELFKVFPAGFVARPAVGVAPYETGRGLFQDTDQFVVELLRGDSILYKPEHRKKPIRSTVLDMITSGEAIVLQDDLVKLAQGTAPVKKKSWREVRVHTFEDRVLVDAVAKPWTHHTPVSSNEVARAQEFVAQFIKKLPQSFLKNQALGFDVFIAENQDGSSYIKIIDLVTNKGRKSSWSTYLDQPQVIAAYIKEFERSGVTFEGLGGTILRRGWGNYFGFWMQKREHAHTTIEKFMAWVPPWP